MAARVHPNYSANRRFHSLQILRWNRVGNFHHLFEKLAFECKFYLEKTPLQKSTGLFSASSCCSCPSNFWRSCRNIRSISAHFPLYENVSTVEGAEVFIELLEPGRSNMAGRSPVAKRRSGNGPERTSQIAFCGSLDGQNGRNLLYICCRFSNLPSQTSYVNLAKANDDENVCWHMVHRNKNLY